MQWLEPRPMLYDRLSNPMTVAYLNRSYSAISKHHLAQSTEGCQHKSIVFNNNRFSSSQSGLINWLCYTIMSKGLLTTRKENSNNNKEQVKLISIALSTIMTESRVQIVQYDPKYDDDPQVQPLYQHTVYSAVSIKHSALTGCLLIHQDPAWCLQRYKIRDCDHLKK